MDPISTAEELTMSTPPHPTYGQLMELCKDFPTVVDALAKNAPKGKRGGDRRSERAKDNQASARTLDRKGGSAAPVLQAKLAERFPEVWADFLAGKFRSVRAAAEKAGLVKPGHDPLARLKSNWKKATAKQRAEFLKFIEAEGA